MKKRTNIMSAAIMAGFSAQLAGAATIAHWRFEEGANGVTHAGNLDNYYEDSSGNGNHLSSWWDGARPMATDDRPFSSVPLTGAANTLALDFVPAQDIATFEPPNAPDVKMINTYMFTSGWTVECSFKLRALYWEVLVGKEGKRGDIGGAVGGEAPFWIKIRDFDKHLEVLVIDDSHNWQVVPTVAPIETDKWYSVAATYDNATLKLYLKGEGDAGYTLQGSLPLAAGVTLGEYNRVWTVGRGMWDGNPADFINGTLDEVRISDEALDPADFINSDGDGDTDGMADIWEVENFGSTAAGVPTNDTDLDGVDDLIEYAYGGDPNVDDAAAISPSAEFIDGGATWEYVYNRRLDATADTLTYDLYWKTNLLDAGWLPSGGIWETNAGAFNAEAEAVTNQIPIGLYGLVQAFVNLQITEGWKPFTFSRANNPSPADDEGNATDDGILSWDAAAGAISYEVYLSTNEAAVAAGDAGVLATNIAATSFDASALVEMYTDYYWRVVPVAGNAVFMPSYVWNFRQTVPNELGDAHKKFIRRGILTGAVVFPGEFGFAGHNATGTNITWATWADSKFNSACTHSGWMDILTGPVGPTDTTYWRWCEGQTELSDGSGNGTISWQEEAYIGGVGNLAALQAADEEDLDDTGWRNAIKAAFDRWKVSYPDTLVYTTQNGPSNDTGDMHGYQVFCKPDMAFMFTYEFKSGGSMNQMWKSCKDFREWGKQGINATAYAEPIPYGMYYQCMNLQDRHVGQSEISLGMFGPITYGYKAINAFVYARNSVEAPGNDIRSEIFVDGGDSVRTALFDVVAENNRQILLMSDTLVRLSSEDIWDVTVNSQITDWSNGNVPGLTGISATPIGGRASSTDRVLIGHFKALSEKLDGSAYSNQDYFMIMNADFGVDGTPAEYQQDITLTVSSDLESINLATGAVETLVRSGGTVTVSLDGGRGKLFKFATGAPFVGFYNGE